MIWWWCITWTISTGRTMFSWSDHGPGPGDCDYCCIIIQLLTNTSAGSHYRHNNLTLAERNLNQYCQSTGCNNNLLNTHHSVKFQSSQKPRQTNSLSISPRQIARDPSASFLATFSPAGRRNCEILSSCWVSSFVNEFSVDIFCPIFTV